MIWWLLPLAALAVAAVPLIREWRRAPMGPAARAAAPGTFAALSQGTTHYRWTGPAQGPVAVCVHGLTTPSFVWDRLAAGLAAEGFRVLAYDLYGRGFSDRPQGPQDRGFFLRQLADLLEHEEVNDDITLIGYSMGGSIATAFAAAHPGRLRRLILLAPAGMGKITGGLMSFVVRTPVIGDWLMLALYPRMLRKGLAAEAQLPGSVPAVNAGQRAELERRGFVPAVLASLRGMLSEVLEPEHRKLQGAGLPVLAIWGRDDRVIPLAARDALAEWNRNARQEVIDGAGHGLTYTHSDAVMAHISGFVRNTR